MHHFVKDCLSYVGPFHTVSNASAGAVRWPRGGLGLVWGCPGVAWGWSGAALGWPGAILLSGNYPGINEILSGISGPAGWGWLGLARAGWGWLGLAGAGWGGLGLAGAEFQN